MIVGTIICMMLGLGLIVLGGLFRARRMTQQLDMLAGVGESMVNDREALARTMGPFLIVVGVFLCALPWLVSRFGDGIVGPSVVLLVLAAVFMNVYLKAKKIVA